MTTRRTIRWGAAAVRVATILTGVVACLWGGMPLLAQERAPKGPAAAAGETRWSKHGDDGEEMLRSLNRSTVSPIY